MLDREYGSGWRRRFRHFGTEPIASASIGQVHRAETHDGRRLALKIQYPGVRQSIDSDVANLALLARTPGLVPAELDPAPLLARVREQLHRETDYRAEARAATEYRRRLGDDPVLRVPAVHEDFSTEHILATDFAAGEPIERLAHDATSQAERDRVAAALCRLSVREFFEMRLVQTDPNFGNYLYEQESGRIALLDFGATEAVESHRVEQLRELGRALRALDRDRTAAAALAAGFIATEDTAGQARGIVDMMLMAGEPLQQRGPYDFGASDLFSRAFDQGRAQFFGDGYGRTPPPDLLFLQRKFVGTFLLCTRLRGPRGPGRGVRRASLNADPVRAEALSILHTPPWPSPRPVYTGRTAPSDADRRAQTPPLTHHEILGWIAPFTRQGRQLDLPASDRLERRLRFKPVEHAAAEPGWPGLREALVLESPEPDRFRLTRTLTLDGGGPDSAHGPLEARLQAEGREPGELLAQIDAVAPWSQFRRGAQHLMALSHRLPTAPRRAEGAAPADPVAAAPVLTEGLAAVAGLRLRFKVPTLHGMPADVAVLTAADDPIELPQDLLAVLGWKWSRLIRVKAGWTGSVQLRGKGLARSRDAQQRARAGRAASRQHARGHARRLSRPARRRPLVGDGAALDPDGRHAEPDRRRSRGAGARPARRIGAAHGDLPGPAAAARRVLLPARTATDRVSAAAQALEGSRLACHGDRRRCGLTRRPAGMPIGPGRNHCLRLRSTLLAQKQLPWAY